MPDPKEFLKKQLNTETEEEVSPSKFIKQKLNEDIDKNVDNEPPKQKVGDIKQQDDLDDISSPEPIMEEPTTEVSTSMAKNFVQGVANSPQRINPSLKKYDPDSGKFKLKNPNEISNELLNSLDETIEKKYPTQIDTSKVDTHIPLRIDPDMVEPKFELPKKWFPQDVRLKKRYDEIINKDLRNLDSEDIRDLTIIRKQTKGLEKPLSPLVYAPLRLYSQAIEKPAWGLTQLTLMGAKAGAQAVGWDAGNLVFKELADFYGSPEKNAAITRKVEKQRLSNIESGYNKGMAMGILSTLLESGTDLGVLFTQMYALGGSGGVKPGTIPKVDKITKTLGPRAGGAIKHAAKLGSFKFTTTPGDVKERATQATYMIGYNITPYIANATGLTGMKAVVTDTLLNTALTSNSYIKSYKNAGGFNKKFMKQAIPQLVMDIGMAWQTRGWPENQVLDMYNRINKARPKELRIDPKEMLALRNDWIKTLENKEELKSAAFLSNKMVEARARDLRINKDGTVHKQDVKMLIKEYGDEKTEINPKTSHKPKELTDALNMTAGIKPNPKGKPTISGEEETLISMGGRKITEIARKLESKLDIEAQFKRIGAPELGKSVKNFFTRRISEREKTKELIKDITKEHSDLSDSDWIRLTYLSAEPKKIDKLSPEKREQLEPVVKKIRNYYDRYVKLFKKLGVINQAFPKSLIRRLQVENVHIKESIKEIGKEATKNKLKYKLQQNKDTINQLKNADIKYVNIPLGMWLGDLIYKKKKPAYKMLKSFFKSRDVIDIRELALSLQRAKIIKPQDVDIRNIMAAYSNKAGRIIATNNIIKSAKKEGLAKLKGEAPDDWQSLPYTIAPEFKGYEVHPAFSNYLENFLRTQKGAYKLNRFLGYAKILQFDNPLFLAGYNIEQSFWLGAMRSPKLPKHIYNAFKTAFKKDKHYWESFDNGLFSKPYIPPFDSFRNEVEIVKKNSLLKQGAEWIRQNFDMSQREGKVSKSLTPITGALDTIYKPLWNIAWNFSDRIPRLISYHYLKDKGWTPKEAADQAALFHGDYASLPPGTRKKLNKILFTPTFKIIMGKLQLKMLKSSGTALKSGGQTLWNKIYKNDKKLKGLSKQEKNLAGGLVATLALEYGRRKLMQAFDFQEEDFGLRYRKSIEDEKGRKKDMVVYLPSASNNILRYFHRWKSYPKDPDKMKGFLNRSKWDLHPVWRTLVLHAQNRKPNTEPISNPFDPPFEQIKDRTWFTMKSIIGVLERFEAPGKNKVEFEKALRKDLKNAYPFFKSFFPTAFGYTTMSKEEQLSLEIRQLENTFNEYIFRDTPESEEQAESRAQRFKGKLQNIVDHYREKYPELEIGEDSE